MERTLLYMTVVIVFIFLILRHKIMPLLAARKAKGTQQPDAAAAVPGAYPYLFPALMQPPPGNAPERRDMYFDYRIVPAAMHPDTPEDSVPAAEAVDAETNRMLADLRRRGIVPSELSVVRITDAHIMIYAVYIL